MTADRKQVIVIGAGAAGLMAAITAAESGAAVEVYEHNDQYGRKLSITGNGACNYTNSDIGPAHYHGDPVFIEEVLQQFSYEDCIAFFQKLGIEPMARQYRFDESRYIYPQDMTASDFADEMYYRALNLGVNFKFGARAERIEAFQADAVIVATGSNAYPATGSDSSIYPLIRRHGIRFTPFLPALCGLMSKDPLLKELKGKRIEGTAVLHIHEEEQESTVSCFGEIQMNEHSISGIPVMQLSGEAAIALRLRKKVSLEILAKDGAHYCFEIHRTAGFDKAQCCSGGVAVSEVDPSTMECVHSKGLYFCGEILDVYGDCGGYNLHFAWATGYIAGKAAAGGIHA